MFKILIMEKVIWKFFTPILDDVNHRYKSWEHCYNAFDNKNESNNNLSLNLGFYLASWGMYRGSSGLLWKDYKIHNEAVEIIKKHYHLRSKTFANLPTNDEVLTAFKELKDFYSKLSYNNGKVQKSISATDTLVSKILLGSLGCLPAFDRYFNVGLFDKEYSVINKASLEIVWNQAKEMRPQIESIQNWIIEKTGIYYPSMKVIDMYYWQIGFEK